jgi:hypothetical protein
VTGHAAPAPPRRLMNIVAPEAVLCITAKSVPATVGLGQNRKSSI